MVVFSKHRVRIGTLSIAVAPQTRHHKCSSAYSAHFLQSLAEDAGIEHTKFSNISLIVVLVWSIGHGIFAESHSTHQRQRHYHTHHTQRICHSTSQGERTSRQSHLLGSLLCRSKRRSISGSSTQHAHQIGKIHACGITCYHCHQQP